MTSMRWVVVAAAMAYLGACRCPPEEPGNCGTIAVTFESPKDNDMVASTLNVSVKATRAGAAVDLKSATLATRPDGSPDFGAELNGTVSGSGASFTGVTLANGSSLIRVKTKSANPTSGGADCEGSGTITVTVPGNMGTPDVTAFTFEGDANNDKTLNAAEVTSAGGKITARITAANSSGCKIKVVDAANMATTIGPAQAVGAGGVATVDLTNLTNPMTGTYSLRAVVTECADASRTNPANDPEALVTLTIDRVAPTCMLADPTVDLVGPNDDADTATAGFQLRASGSATGENTMELTLTGGQTTGPQTPANHTLLKDFTIPSTGAADYTVTLIARDAAGNRCEVARQVSADFAAPVVTLTSPTQAGSPYATFMIPVTAAVTDVGNHANGQNMVCSSTLGNIGGPFPVANDMVSGMMGNFPAGSQTVSCTVTDRAGNTSAPATQMINVTGAAGCPLNFTAPSTSPATLTRSSGTVSGNTLTYTFRLQSTAACVGKAVTLNQVVGANRTLVGMGPADATGLFQQSAMLPNSPTTPLVFEASIATGTGVITQQLFVSLDVPTILTPAAGTINASSDLSDTLPGVQRQLTYSPVPPNGSTCTICSTVALTDAGTPCPDGTGFVYQTGVVSPANSFTFPNGTYGLKPVFVSAGNPPEPGPVVQYVVDGERPKVLTVTFTNDANNDKTLNATEQASGAPEIRVTFEGVENGQTFTVVNLGDNSQATGTVTANAGTATLANLNATATTSASFNLEIRVNDAAGNPNNPPNVTPRPNPEAFVILTVDRVAPTCAFTFPDRAQLGTADDADGSAAGYQLRAVVSTSADVNGAMAVTVNLAGGATANASGMANPTYQHDFTVAATGEVDYTLTATCRDDAGNTTTTAPLAVRVDNQPPTACMLVAPSGSTVFSNPAITTTVSAINANGLVPVITSTAGGGGNLPAISGNTSSAVLNYLNGLNQTVTATITDVAGNRCTATQVISVMSAGCNVVLTAPATNPAFLNRSNDATPGSATTLEYRLTGTSANCPNTLVRLFRGTPGIQVDSVMTDGAGAFGFDLSLPEGPEHLEARMDNGVQPTQAAVDVTVDLTDPTVSGVSPSGANLFFVAPSNDNVRRGVAGYIVDADPPPGMADGQVAVAVTVGGAVGGTVTVLYMGNPVAGPTTLSTNPQTVNYTVTLGNDTTGPFVIRVRDQAGNQVDTTSTVKVDVEPPADPVLTANPVAGQDRAANVALSWTAVGDNGMTGTVTGYDVRWTTATVQPTGLASSADFFDSSRAYAEATVTATARTVRVPTLNSYFFYVRAVDEVGNYSGFVSATKIDNPLLAGKQTFGNPRTGGVSGDIFGAYMATGRINSDSFDDLVVGVDSSTPNLIYIYYGSANGLGATPQQIGPPDNSTNVGWGRPIAVGKPSSSTTPDVLVSSFSHAGLGAGAPLTAGMAVLYFGGAGAMLDTSATNYVQFTGTVTGGSFGRGMAIVPDINEDGFDEIAISAPFEGTNRAGNVYFWYGRSQAAWKALPQPILATAADRIFNGAAAPASPLNARFGRRPGGFANVGRVGASGAKDLAIPASFEYFNSLYLYSGATLNSGATGMMIPTSSAFQQLTAGSVTNDVERGFGSRAVGDINVVMGTASDLVVSYPVQNTVYVFADRTGAGFPSFGSQAVTLSESTAFQFGTDFQVVDFDGDGFRDLFIGSFSTATPNVNTGLFIYPNRGTAGSEFDTAVGTRYFRSKISPLVAGSSMGSSVVLGDFNNDGKPDLAAADHLDGVGKVFVWQ